MYKDQLIIKFYLLFLFYTKQKRAFKQIFLIKLKFLGFELAIQQREKKNIRKDLLNSSIVLERVERTKDKEKNWTDEF